MVDSIKVEIKGFKQFEGKVSRLTRKKKPKALLRKLNRKAMTKAKRPLVKKAKSMAPKDRGVLGLSMRGKVGRSGNTQWLIVGARVGSFTRTLRKQKSKVDAFYSHMVEGGTKPHAIPRIKKTTRGRQKKLLVFSVGGKTITVRRVRHPGTKPTRFLAKTSASAGKKAQLIYMSTMDRFITQHFRV